MLVRWMTPTRTPRSPNGPAARASYPAAYKARILAEYDGLSKADKGALLRREGLYSSLLIGVAQATRPRGDERAGQALGASCQPTHGTREIARLKARHRDASSQSSTRPAR